MNHDPDSLDALFKYPLIKALLGRRARRFGLGMEIPSGPLAFKSTSKPIPLSELEKLLLVSAGTGVTGWNFGIPYGPAKPNAHADYTVRYTGRTFPTAAGIGTPVLFYTDDNGIYLTNTRDIDPERLRGYNENRLDQIMDICREHTLKISESRLDLPKKSGHMLEPNQWWANSEGSTLFMPVGDSSEQMLGLISLLVSNGTTIMDDDKKSPAGDLTPFIRSGLLDKDKVFPLSILEKTVYEFNCAELAFMAHNIVLMMQAMGLGGLYFGGLNSLSVFGSPSAKGVKGLGFRFIENDDWLVPNPVGLDGLIEGLCPPYYSDMRAAVEAFVDRKFGVKGAYDHETPGPWLKSSQIKQSVECYSDEMVDCLGEIAQYVYDKHGKFPGTIPTMVLPGYVQAHHLETDYYDEYFKPGAYLQTHSDHLKNWHSDKE